MSHQHSTSQDPGMEAYQAGGLPYNANEHGGLEPNPLADGGSAPEVVAAPVDYYASPEKDASGQYPPQQYHQQPTQWAHEPMLPKYPGTPADPGYGVDHSNQAGAYDYATPAQYQGDDAYHPPIPAGAPVAEEEKPGPRWCGMPRKRAMILMIVAVLIVIAVAVGVGVGVGDKKSSSPSTVAYVSLLLHPLSLGLLHLSLCPLLPFLRFIILGGFPSSFLSSPCHLFCASFLVLLLVRVAGD